MEFLIADSFISSVGKLTREEQKAVKTSVFDLQTNPTTQGLQLHRVDASRDANFWSCRVDRDIRIIIHKTASSLLLAYVDHHDDAYKWAERRRIEAHPKTGAIQIVEIRERVEEIARPRPLQQQLDLGDGVDLLRLKREDNPQPALPFRNLGADKLLSVGVPADWISDILAATEDRFLDIAEHLPAEAGEALLEFVATGVFNPPAPVIVTDPFQHPDTLRRFRSVENRDELEQALSFPWEKWIVFLHPAQQALVDQQFDGPVRVMGSAGTGKTVVALHRTVKMAARSPNSRVLLTTFSDPLAISLERKLKILVGDKAEVVPRISVASFFGIAKELYQLVHGRHPVVANGDLIRGLLTKAATASAGPPIPERFLLSEWFNVVDAWQVTSAEAYANAPRLGRKSRMGNKQRDRLWPIFQSALRQIAERGLVTEAGIFRSVSEHYRDTSHKPFDSIVIDEAQDLGVPELRFLTALAPSRPDALFFTGDLGQRIFHQPFSWKSLGVDVGGRSFTLEVNYRTSHQIRETADRLLSAAVSDADGEKADRGGTISVFNGPDPVVVLAETVVSEQRAVADFIQGAISDGINPEEIGVFVRTREVMGRARQAVKLAGSTPFELTPHKEGPPGDVRIGIMHLAKGLEFKAVAVLGCDEDLLPLRARIEAVADEVELDDVYATERQLFYVACTRARDRLLIGGIKPASEFLGDLSLRS
jgi:hypothetical protein